MNMVNQVDDNWVSVSDLMSGLMMIFLLISITYMIDSKNKTEELKQIAEQYRQQKHALYLELTQEFEHDFNRWGAEIKDDLSIRFKEPKILFGVGSYTLNTKFKDILADFFPRYIKIISNKKYKKNIREIRIEGHTSSEWGSDTNQTDAYFHNMELSQSRTRTTLKYVLTLDGVKHDIDWLMRYMTANGLASSRPVYDIMGKEDTERSKRVEFRIINNAAAYIDKILVDK